MNLHDYRLKVDGDVSNPLDLTLDDLRAMSSVQRTLNIGCVLGWAADVPWEGIPLSHLLSLAGAPAKIAHVTVASVTGYAMTMGSDEAANPDNMIALKAGGVPLTVEHGYPARLVVPTRSGLVLGEVCGKNHVCEQVKPAASSRTENSLPLFVPLT